MSTLKCTTLSKQDGSASVPVDTVVNGSAKAWVNFNGTGVPAIRAAFNVSSITDTGLGDYTLNFTTAMPDTLYVTAFMAPTTDLNYLAGIINETKSTASTRFTTANLSYNSSFYSELAQCNVVIFR